MCARCHRSRGSVCHAEGVDDERSGKISVFFPMWNEEEYIDRAVDAAARRAKSSSTTARSPTTRSSSSTTPRPTRHPASPTSSPTPIRTCASSTTRRTASSAARVKTGFAEAKGDLVLYTDADLPFDMDELKRACRLLRIYEADIVCAYRFDRTGEGFRPRRLLRDLQPARPGVLRSAGPRRQLRLQARAPFGARRHDARRARARSSTPSWSCGR